MPASGARHELGDPALVDAHATVDPVHRAPVLLGRGTPFFDQLEGAPFALEGPISVTEGTGVTHLRYRVVHS